MAGGDDSQTSLATIASGATILGATVFPQTVGSLEWVALELLSSCYLEEQEAQDPLSVSQLLPMLGEEVQAQPLQRAQQK